MMARAALLLATVGLPAMLAAQAVPAPATPAPIPPQPQNPSPMVEYTRAHERLAPRDLDGTTRSFSGPLGRPVEVFVPATTKRAEALTLVVHFLGSPFIAEYAVSRLGGNDKVAAVVNVGAGSGIYDRTFSDPPVFDSLLAAVGRETSAVLGRPTRFTRIVLSGFSAGHGAIRAILRDSAHFARVDAVLLLDGMHTSYVPEGTVIEKGGTLDERNLVVWERYARAAIRGEKRFLVTHSEIFPGTFASTTETADWLIRTLGLKRTPVVKWGPRGMQQLSEVRSGRFEIQGYAGNSGPDHIDQFHSMPELLARLLGR